MPSKIDPETCQDTCAICQVPTRRCGSICVEFEGIPRYPSDMLEGVLCWDCRQKVYKVLSKLMKQELSDA